MTSSCFRFQISPCFARSYLNPTYVSINVQHIDPKATIVLLQNSIFFDIFSLEMLFCFLLFHIFLLCFWSACNQQLFLTISRSIVYRLAVRIRYWHSLNSPCIYIESSWKCSSFLLENYQNESLHSKCSFRHFTIILPWLNWFLELITKLTRFNTITFFIDITNRNDLNLYKDYFSTVYYFEFVITLLGQMQIKDHCAKNI